MAALRKKIEDIITGKREKPDRLLKKALSVLAMGYQGAVRFRNAFYDAGLAVEKQLPCKVVSIGNLCVGGTGKTPMTVYAANILQKSGYAVCVVSRGYKGQAEHKGGIVSDGKKIFMSPAQAGDEPYMMAKALKGIPVIVGKDRFQCGLTAVNQFNANVIVLDDAFQHRQLFRDIDLVLLDGREPFGNGKLLPRGRLREPAIALKRSHAVIFTRSENNKKERLRRLSEVKKISDSQPVFYAIHHPYIVKIIHPEEKQGLEEKYTGTSSMACLKGKDVVAFSGLGANENFKQTIESIPARIVAFFEFADHHFYSELDIKEINRTVAQSKVDYIVTTEKDYTKLPKRLPWAIAIVVIGIRMDMGEDANAFEQFLNNNLS